MSSRKEYGKRDMEVALTESMQDYEKIAEEQERQILQNSNAQFEEEQIMQMALKESMQALPNFLPDPHSQYDEDEYQSESEMMRRAIEMSR